MKPTLSSLAVFDLNVSFFQLKQAIFVAIFIELVCPVAQHNGYLHNVKDG